MSNRRGRQICRLFNTPGGCGHQNCKFLHERTGGPTPSSSSTAPHSPRPSGNSGRITAGRGNCEFFWTSGECRRGFDCMFRHVRQPQTQNAAGATVEATSPETDTLDFLTTEGLSGINNISLDKLHTLSPTGVHNMLRAFNSPTFQFTAPDQVIKFVQILASVDRRNPQWDTARAQSFLEMIVDLKHHVLARIREVLQYSPVACRAGTGFTVLSFQIGYFPLLQFFGSDLILKTNLHHNIHALYSALDNGLDHMLDVVSSCMEQMIQNRSWKDPTPALPAIRQSSLSGVVVFGTITTLLTQYFQHFKHAINNHPDIVVFVGNLVRWYDEWVKLIATSSFDDSIDASVQRLTLKQIKESIIRLDAIVKREPVIRYRHSQPHPGKNKHAESSLRKAALDSRIQNTAQSANTATNAHFNSATSMRTSQLNPHRHRRHADASYISPTVDPDNHATTDSSRFQRGIRNDVSPGDCTMEYGLHPRYARGYLWQDPDSLSWHTPMTTATWTETLPPMPQPPHNELNNHIALRTIKSHPALFRIVTPINIMRFRKLLDSHPNRELVSSVCTGLKIGFWPWADTNNPEYPITNDNSFRPLKDHSHVEFVRSQRDTEISLGRFSHSFGSELLPGMHSVPIGVVSRPHSTKLRMIVDHSAGYFSPNSMIPKHEVHAHVDTLKHLGSALIQARHKYGRNVKLVLFKSDVSKAYRQLPMHVLWQICQVVTIDNQHHVDRCNNIGNRGAGRIWGTFFGLVLWIATFVKLLTDIFGYVDDSFSWEFADKKTWYGPYQKYLPTKQTALLTLFDELGVPHEEEKQLHGYILTIIGLDVDPNAMTITMPDSSRLELISAIRNFAVVGSQHSLHDFESLGGWCNWSFNAYPLLRPGLSMFYAKKHGKTQPFQLIGINKALCHELIWMAEHLEHMPGILLLDSLEWGPHLADILVQTNASSKGLGIWIPQLATGYYSHVTMPSEEGTFFNEALAVVSALLMTLDLSSRPHRILIYTDNTNTVDIFDSLHAKPLYNPLLITAVDALITHKAQLRVLHIPRSQNTIADALSQDNHDFVLAQHPNARIRKFSLPQLKSGSDNVK